MAALNELIQKIENQELRAQIQVAADRLTKQKKFGLVFEEHLPECTLLYDIPVRKGLKVSVRNGKANEIYTVLKIEDSVATCLSKSSKEVVQFALVDLVTTAELGDPIYPCLQSLGEICNAPDSELWHTLIEADNYHALQLLEYLYAGKVDCIYIDPPYNTGARDWKYNNDYVDGTDEYRHSKWLSFMQKRLKIAKKLLNTKNSFLVVTIDEKEFLHLGCLLEEMFPEARIQMVDSVINRKGVSRKGKKGDSDREEITQFSRVSEYIYFVMFGSASIKKSVINMLDSHISETSEEEIDEDVQWLSMLRRGAASQRADKPKHFYPIFVNPCTASIVAVGDPIPLEASRESVEVPEGLVAVWPMRTNGSEGRWQLKRETFVRALKEGTAKLGSYNKKQDRWAINYLNEGILEEISNGAVIVLGKDKKGALILRRRREKLVEPKSVWNQTSHNASEYGTTLLNEIIGKRFEYPKSLYAVEDVFRMCTGDNKEALIVDFFAGSGTSLHAVNLLNAEDHGCRRCIMVTNNEVSVEEAENLSARGYKPGDDEWEKYGIARYVTWPRTVCSINGCDINGVPLAGDYGILDEEYVLDEELTVVSKKTGNPINRNIFVKKKVQKRPTLATIKKSDGFQSNVAFFKLSFLDKTKVSLGMQFKDLLSTLWMKAGAVGKCPTIDATVRDMLILPDNKMAILNDENNFGEFVERLANHPEIKVVYLVTDYESSFVAMTQALEGKKTYQLYRDYLDNFRINAGRNSR